MYSPTDMAVTLQLSVRTDATLSAVQRVSCKADSLMADYAHTNSTNDFASAHWPISSWNFTLLSTSSMPSSDTRMPTRSSGRGAGPSKLTPVM